MVNDIGEVFREKSSIRLIVDCEARRFASGDRDDCASAAYCEGEQVAITRMEVSRDVRVDFEVERLFDEGFKRCCRVMTRFGFCKG